MMIVLKNNICSEKVDEIKRKIMTHHLQLFVFHGWLNLPLGGCHGCDGAGFGCGAEVGLHHLSNEKNKDDHLS